MQNLNVFFKKLCKNPRGLLVALVAILAVAVTVAPQASALYLVSGVESSAIVLNGSNTAPSIDSQLIDVTPVRGGHDIQLKDGQPITISYQGATISGTARNESISSLLRRLEIVPSPLDMISVSVSENQVSITVASDITLYERVDEPAAYETIRRPNPAMLQGEEKVVQDGKDGFRTSVYEVVWSNGEMISRQFVERLDSTAQDEIIEYGTATLLPSDFKENIHSPIASVNTNPDGSGTLTLTTGEILPFSGVKEMRATAYTAGHDGVGTLTATGTRVHRGTVAVDRKVVPLGTRMYIVTNDGSYVYGLSVAEDTGYWGNNLDLYHDTYDQCINFGRRGVTVYFLE